MNKSVLALGAKLLLNGFSVVFAVLVALAVDEWNEDRELRAQAERARTAVISEIQANREESRAGIHSSQEMLASAMETLGYLRRGEELPDQGFEGSLPEFSDAAWETARVTGIVAHMDYGWVLETAKVYEAQDLTKGFQRSLFDLFGTVVARPPDEERFADLVGQLALLNSLQTQLVTKIDSLLVRTPGVEPPLDTGVTPSAHPDSTEGPPSPPDSAEEAHTPSDTGSTGES